LLRAFGVSNRDIVAVGIQARRRWQIVIRHCQSQVWPPHSAFGNAKAFKGLRASDFVDKVTIDKDKAGPVVALLHDMGITDFFVQRLRCGHHKNAIEAIAAKSSEAALLALQN
jgi:hypothetical protein